MIVIGITGTFGAGKGTVVKYLQGCYGIESFSMRTMIAKCADDHYGVLVENRDDLRVNGNRLRKEFGPDILVRTAADCAEGKNDCTIAVIESIRCVGEVNHLAERFGQRFDHSFLLLAVDAKQKERFKRITSRGDATDKVTFEEFCRQESAELVGSSPWEQNLMECAARANHVIHNNGSEKDLYTAVGKFLNEHLPLR